MSERGSLAPELPQDEVALVEVLDRVLHTGVVLRGDVVLSVADIDLIYLKLELLLTSVANARAHAERPVIYAFAIIAGEDAASVISPPLPDVGGAPVTATMVDDVAVIACDMTSQLPDARAHAAVVQSVHHSCTAVLPIRLGAVFDDQPQLIREVRSRADDLRESLRRLAGCSEIAVRAHWVAGDPSSGLAQSAAVPAQPGRAGTAYLRSRAARDRRERLVVEHGDALREEIALALGDRALAITAGPRTVSGDADTTRLSVLVPTVGTGPALELIAAAAQRHPQASIRAFGPLPPYSFAGESV